MENQSMCRTHANVISPYNHLMPDSVSGRKQGNQSLGCLDSRRVHIQKGPQKSYRSITAAVFILLASPFNI